MKKIYCITSVSLLVAWAIVMIVFKPSPAIHTLPWLAIVLAMHAMLTCQPSAPRVGVE